MGRYDYKILLELLFFPQTNKNNFFRTNNGNWESSFANEDANARSLGFPDGTRGKKQKNKTKQNPSANAGEGKRCRFDPWFGDIPWRRAQQPPPVFLPGESHGQRSLAGYSPWGHRESDMTEATYCACRDVLKDYLRYVFIQIPNTEHGTISFSEWPGNLSSAARKS